MLCLLYLFYSTFRLGCICLVNVSCLCVCVLYLVCKKVCCMLRGEGGLIRIYEVFVVGVVVVAVV